MDIRTKLVFALVATSLASLLALVWIADRAASQLYRRTALRQLEAVAESKKEHLEEVIARWRDEVVAAASRTDLREALAAWPGRRGDPRLVARIEAVLGDVRGGAHAMRETSVYGADGYFVAADPRLDAPRPRVRPAIFLWAESPVLYRNVGFHPDDGLRVSLMAPVRVRGRLVGAVEATLAAGDLLAIATDTTGLGETGETVLARRTEAGDALILSPLRHALPGEGPGPVRVPAAHVRDPVLQAVLGTEAVVAADATDYRGERVWAATRHLDDFGWGVVVKVDEDEELAPLRELRGQLVRLALSLSALAIVAGTWLGFAIARPIRNLADVARRVCDGELEARAAVAGEDEVALLADAFNEMTEKLVRTRRAPGGRDPREAAPPGGGRAGG